MCTMSFLTEQKPTNFQVRVTKKPKPKKINPYSFGNILKLCAEEWCVTESDILGKMRYVKYAYPRQSVVYLVRCNTGFSHECIGSFMNRDHSTMIHSCKVVVNRLHSRFGDPYYIKKLENVEKKLKEQYEIFMKD